MGWYLINEKQPEPYTKLIGLDKRYTRQLIVTWDGISLNDKGYPLLEAPDTDDIDIIAWHSLPVIPGRFEGLL